MSAEVNAAIRAALTPYVEEVKRLRAQVAQVCMQGNDGVQPGRRVFYNFVGSQLFTTTQDGVRGAGITFLVSQDGPFYMTHYPVVMWRTTLPTNATDFGIWRPVRTWPLAVQELTNGTIRNYIDISYEMNDAGSQRNFQNAAAPPILSDPSDLKALPAITKFKENSSIEFIPTYENISLGGSTATTEGRLVVCLPGFRVITGDVGNY